MPILSLSLLANFLWKGADTLKDDVVLLNNAPVVKFTSPKPGSKVKRNTLVPYSIEVLDKEDGESKFGEIASEEVFLEVKMFTNNAEATAYLNKEVSFDPVGFSAIKKSDCFNCHNQKTKLIGPSFEEIAERYRPKSSNINKIADHIRKGVSGTWGDAAMPAHPDLKEDIAAKMVQWILENGRDPTVDYLRGIQGTFWFRPPPLKPGIYVLTASYIDHGNGERPETSLKGSESVMITEAGD